MAQGQVQRRFTLGREIVNAAISDTTVAYVDSAHWDNPTDSRIALIDWRTGAQRGTLGHCGYRPGELTFSPDGKVLACYCRFDPTREILNDRLFNRIVQLWEVASTSGIRNYEVGSFLDFGGLAFAGDGRYLASLRDRKTAIVWDLAFPPDREHSQRVSVPIRWADIAQHDPARAYVAIWRLRLRPREAVALIGARLTPAKGVRQADIDKRIGELDDPLFKVREKASRQIELWSGVSEPFLRKALAAPHCSLEKRRRLQQLLAALPQHRLAETRAISVLEFVRTPAARALLGRLANGDPHACLTQDAKAALKRLDKL